MSDELPAHGGSGAAVFLKENEKHFTEFSCAALA